MKYFFFNIICLVLLANFVYPQQININKKNAEVWGTSQNIKGKLDSFYVSTGNLYLNDSLIIFNISNTDSSFAVPIIIKEGINNILVSVNNNGSIIKSDTLKLKLAYKLVPEVFAYAESNSGLYLKGRLIENPKNLPLSFLWEADANNPSTLPTSNPNDTINFININNSIPKGEYYYNLYTITSEGDTVKSRTMFTVTNDSLKIFDIKKDHAAWIDSAVIYEITPYIFVNNGKFNNITTKIPDLIRLGVNTIWIQPVYSTSGGGQGYDITDYFKVRTDLGTEEDLLNLVRTAKAYGLKVMFDFVANHSSINHPYAVNSTQYGTNSHYWDYYQREVDNAPYSQHYHFYGGFINYFWDELPNFNFNNSEVRKWMIEAVKYWVKKYDIDGYRFDAIWGVTARYPQFTKDLRIALKSIKPELLLLGEDKASQPQVFDERFDAAFDWTAEESWVSHWSWQTQYSTTGNMTIFNYSNENSRSNLLRTALTNNGNGYSANAKVLHFLDNNDQPYIMTYHGKDRSKMAAALLLTLNGIPLIYNGEEIGKTGHPYSTEYIFLSGRPMDYNDANGFFPYYQKLIKYRKNLPALYSNNYSEITVSPSNSVFGFRRWDKQQNIFTILNMSASLKNVAVTLPVEQMGVDTTKNYYLIDVLSGETFSGTINSLKNFSTTMNLFSAKVFLLSDSLFLVNVNDDKNIDNIIPDELTLNQNYPNPFNPYTTISFSTPTNGNVEIKVYDILGKEVAVLMNGYKERGNYKVSFDASKLPSGMYIYNLRYNGKSISKKMMVLK